MVKSGLNAFKDKNVLFLQGPVGPFFDRLADDMQRVGAKAHRINFNAGDRLFSSSYAVDFTGTIEEWPAFFGAFLDEHAIDAVIVFGDCRPLHRIAHTIASNRGLTIGVFEEGYVRPDFITFEEFGVNGHSLIPRDPRFYRSLSMEEWTISQTYPVGNTFYHAMMWAMLYYFVASLGKIRFRHYAHHRPLNFFEGAYWWRALGRKWMYRFKERGVQPALATQFSKNYFLVPLQIATDAQVMEHSSFASVEHFIERVMESFAANAPTEMLLVIKHHPLDRGYHDYTALIRHLSKRLGIEERVWYIHDQHLPTLLEHARGVVVINSTVGLSAIHHNAPLKTCGTAIYDMEGLTYRGNLESFWADAEEFTVDRDLYDRFRGYVINAKQINGNFYRRLHRTGLASGIFWKN